MKLVSLLLESYFPHNMYNDKEFVQVLENAIEGGGSSFICSYVASAIKMLEGDRVKVYGFSQEKNPSAVFFNDEDLDPDEGHHFAVLDDRFIIDPWIYNNYKDYNKGEIFGKSVYDLQDNRDSKTISYIYGDRSCWVDITSHVDDFNKLFPKSATTLKNFKNDWVKNN